MYKQENINFIDPRGQPTETASSDHYFRRGVCTSVRPSVPIFQILAIQNKAQVWK